MSPSDRPRPRVRPPGCCPTCGKPSDPSRPVRPFCSDRCKMVDLGRWLRGDYVVPGESVEPGAPDGEGPWTGLNPGASPEPREPDDR